MAYLSGHRPVPRCSGADTQSLSDRSIGQTLRAQALGVLFWRQAEAPENDQRDHQ